MTRAALFETAHKNALLNCLTGNAASLAAQTKGYFATANSYLQLYSSVYGDTSAPMGSIAVNTGAVANFGTAIRGTIPVVMPWTSNVAEADVVWARWGLYDATPPYTFVDGLVTLSGGGGMLIISSATIPLNGTVQLSGVFKMSVNNGGTLRINYALANAMLDVLVHDVNWPALCTSSGTLSVYDGDQPATADTPVTTQNVLQDVWNSIDLYGPYAAAAGGSASLSGDITAAATAVNTGTATWYRWNRGGLVMDGSCGGVGSGADMILASTDFVQGQATPHIVAATLAFP